MIKNNILRFLLLAGYFFLIDPAWSIEAVCNNEQFIYFIDGAVLKKYSTDGWAFKGQCNMPEDTAFVSDFAHTLSQKWSIEIDQDRLKKKMKSGKFVNITCKNHSVLVSVIIANVDSNRIGQSYLFLEYTEDLRYSGFYFLEFPGHYRYGYAELYPRFRQIFDDQGNILLPLSNYSRNNTNDSEACFGLFKFDKKRNEVRFIKPVMVGKTKQTLGQHIFSSATGRIVYPLNIPLSYTNSDITFQYFPFLLFRNLNKKPFYDPFNQYLYARDSLEWILDFDLSKSYSSIYSSLQVRQLLLAYAFIGDTLKMVLKSYSSHNDPALILIRGTTVSVKPLPLTKDFGNMFYYFLCGRLLIIEKKNGEFVFTSI